MGSYSDKLLESFLNGVMKKFTTEHLRRAVREDIDLIEVHRFRGLSYKQQKMAKTTMDRLFEMGRNVAANHASEELTLKTVLKWIAKNRLDFFNEIKHDKESLQWLKRQTELIRLHFYSPPPQPP